MVPAAMSPTPYAGRGFGTSTLVLGVSFISSRAPCNEFQNLTRNIL